MNKNILFKVSILTAVVVVCLFGVQLEAKAAMGDTVVLSQNSTVKVKYESSSADENSVFGLYSPTRRDLGTKNGTAIGTEFDLGSVASGTELVFFIKPPCGLIWQTGPASRNSDYTIHANITSISQNQWRIAFEDLPGGGDRDFNDIVLLVTATPSCTQNVAKQCVGNDIYWFDSCNNKGNLYQTCASNQTCQNGACINNCTPNSTKKCVNNDVYWFDSCNTQGSLFQACTANQICQNGSCVNQNITCSSNSQCGTNGYTGSPFCQGNNVYQNYITYTCNNAGTTSSYCSSNTAAQQKDTCASGQTCSNGSCITQSATCNSNSQCGTNGYIGSPICQGGNVYQNYVTYTCNNAGALNSYCSSNIASQLKTTCSSGQTCSNGSCGSITCSSNSDCGSNNYTGSPFCQGNNVYQNYITYTCNNAGTTSSYCSSNTASQLKTSCSSYQTCSSGSCSNTQNCTQNSYQRCNGNYLYWYDSCGNQQSNYQYCPSGCYNNSCQSNVSGNLTITKYVRNLTTGTSFASSTNASPSDVLMFMITLQATNQDVQNVYVRDSIPANLIYNNQLTVACTTNNGNNYNCNGNNYNNYSGSITSGINLNTIYNGQTVTVTYQAQVAPAYNFSYGVTTLTNSTSVTGSNSNYNPVSNATVYVTRSAVLGASSVSTGLTNNFWVDSFFLPLLMVIIVLIMWKSGMFFGVEKWMDNRKKARDAYMAKRELSSRIKQIKQAGQF